MHYNLALVRFTKYNFIGCASHWFQFTVCDNIIDFNDTIEKTTTISLKLPPMKDSACLRILTNFRTESQQRYKMELGLRNARKVHRDCGIYFRT